MIAFSIPGRAPATSSPNSRVNWRVRHAAGKEYAELVTLLAQSAKPPGWGLGSHARAVVTFTQYAVRLRDHDNFAASMKPALDAIVRAGILSDDNPGVIDLVLKAVKVSKTTDERVEVTIKGP